MLKLSRKVVGLLMTAMLAALILAACGDNTATTAPAATTAAATTAAATTSAATTAAATTAASATTAAAATTAASATTAAATTAAGTTAAATGTTAAAGASASSVVACDKPVAAASSGKTFRVGISVQNTIPALQQAIDGTKKGLEQCGFVEGKNIKYDVQNALGDIPALATIGRKFADDKDDLIVAVGSQALSNMYNTNKDAGTPIVFNSVTDPYSVLPNVIKSPTDHGQVTGIQALPPVEDGLKLAQEIIPNVKNVGLIYNPSEANSVANVKTADEVAKKLNLNIVKATIQNSGEVLTAAQSIADKVDFYYVTTDVTLVNSLEALLKVAADNKKPVIGIDPTSAPRGVPVSIGLSYYDNGVASAKLAAAVLDGKKPIDVQIEKAPYLAPVVNLKGAEMVGMKIPDSVLNRASQKLTTITPPQK
ncbi:MAG TPA: ABC transporter substrate-binding protein [Chloroflexia bacterium]|nr:ABC transporter substrate-binding protein [Chloroflexia bacterium]